MKNLRQGLVVGAQVGTDIGLDHFGSRLERPARSRCQSFLLAAHVDDQLDTQCAQRLCVGIQEPGRIPGAKHHATSNETSVFCLVATNVAKVW